MKKAYSYIRFSSEAQGLGDSLRRQGKLSEDYAERHGLQLVQNFQDLGISAFKGKNKENALGAFIEAVKTGKIEKGSYLLIESLDRLSREKVLSAFKQFTELLELGIVVITLQDGQRYDLDAVNNNIGSLFTSLGIMLRANNESEEKSNRLSEAWKEKRKVVNEKIYTSKAPTWLKVVDGEFEIIEDRVKIVQRIFQMCNDGYGTYAITRRFNDENLECFGYGKRLTKEEKEAGITKRVKIWHNSYIKKIIKNIAVLGRFQPHKMVNGKRVPDGKVIENYFPSIISVEAFEKASNMIESRNNKQSAGRRGGTFSNVFTGLLKCSCKNSLRYIDKGSGSKPFLICSNHYLGGSCKSPKWVYQDFEKDFFRFVKDFDLNILLDDNDNQKNLLSELQSVKVDIEVHKKRLQDVLDTLERLEEISPEIITSLNKKLENLKSIIKDKEAVEKSLEAQLKSLEIETYQEAVEEFRSLTERLEGVEKEETYRIRQRINNILKSLIKEITIYNGQIVFPYEVYLDDEIISKDVREWLVNNGYNTLKKQERFFETKKGLEAYDMLTRSFIVTFKNGKTIFVKPSQEFSIERITTEELKRRLKTA